VFFDLSMLAPGGKVSQLSLHGSTGSCHKLCILCSPRRTPKAYVVPIVRHPHLRADHEDLSVVNDDSTIVVVVLVCHRPGNRGRRVSQCSQRGTADISHSNVTDNVSSIRVS
jgi:hypothetical protein